MYVQKNDTYAKAYVEILEIIKYMERKYRNKIPLKLIKFFEENKDSSYKYNLNEIKERQSEIFSQKTIELLAMLELKYLTNKEEKELLKNALEENEKKYQEQLREKYNPDNLFKKDIKTKEDNGLEDNNADKMLVVAKKENILKRIINKIKKYFTKN